MVGDGELMEVCRRMVGALGLGHAVTFPGVLSPLEISILLRQCRGFVQHSVCPESGDSEGTPVSILEASSSGLPVISTRHGGIPEAVIDGTSGFLVPEGDLEGMASAMLNVAEDGALAARMGQRGREHILNHFSIDRSMARLEAVVARVTGPGIE